MRRLHPAVVIFVLVFSTLATADPLIAGKPFARASASTIDLGRRIFEHNWARPESWTGPEKLGKGGDGLGPMFNEVSCAACHKLGGVGGAGPNEQNVELLSLDLTGTPLISARQRALDIANQIHPAFNRSNASIVLHQFGFGPDDDEQEYQAYRFDLKSRIRQENFASGDTPQISFELAQRNTPPLWGMGLIEALHTPQFRNERERIASEQKKNNRRGVSGRVPETNGGDEGWYGWRGQVSDLKDFVTSACAMELGLEVPSALTACVCGWARVPVGGIRQPLTSRTIRSWH
ncbi:MAG: hypothetical protein R3B91_11920 [Planctomycetaceae bacterium]